MELGEVHLIQDTLQTLLDCVDNKDNNTSQLSPSSYITPEESTFTMEKSDLEHGEVDMCQETFRNLLDCVKYEDNHTHETLPSIYMARGVLRDMSPSSFSPRIVSIGPLHREDKDVQAFEKQKIIHMINLMRRTELPLDEILKSCVEKVCTSMEEIKACYVWSKPYDNAKVAKMMILDACFILEFIHWFWRSYEPRSGNKFLFQTIIYDLVLLENQIPLFVLNQIYQCTILINNTDTSLIEYIYPLLDDLNRFTSDINIQNVSIHTHHILSLLHECYKPCYSATPMCWLSNGYSVLDLARAGVSFKPYQDPAWELGMDVKSYTLNPWFFGLWSKLTLRMPVLKVDDNTELIFRNLIAYEQQSSRTHNYITSYAYAMDMLVNTEEDVAKLVESKVMVNFIGSNEEAANMINNICKRVAFVDFFYGEQWKTLDKYCNSYWPKHIARMRSIYFSSPWNAIALFAGIIIFTLTVVQTIFTVISAGNK